jgi:hypothetical protein
MTTPMPDWTFWADASTGSHKAFGQLSVIGFTCNWVLSDFGSAEAVIPVAHSALSRADLLGFYKWRLWALYRGVPVWGGLATGLLDDGGDAVTVSLTELPGYLARKVWAQQVVYGAVDQSAIASDVAARLDNVGVPRLITTSGSARNRPQTIAFLDGPTRGDLLRGLAQLSGGIQFRSEYSLSSASLPVCTLHIDRYQVGQSGSGLALQVPGGAVSFQAQWGSDLMRTRTLAVGGVENVSTPPMPATAIPAFNNSSQPVKVTISDAKNVTSVQVAAPASNSNEVGTGGGTYTVPPGGSIYLLYTVPSGASAPNWAWATALPHSPVGVADLPQAGVPNLDYVDDHPRIFETGPLTDRANTAASVYAGPSVAITAVSPVSRPALGTYGVGDDVSVALADPLLPAGWVTIGTLTRIEADAVAGTVTWTVAITAPAPRPGRTLTGRLGRLERKVAGMFHTTVEVPPGIGET